MKKLIVIYLLFGVSFLYGQRIKDIAYFNSEKPEQIIGYGLVVGLASTGDTQRSTFTIQSITSMLKRFGITVRQHNLRVRNVAAVMVTATLNSYLKPGAKFDLTVSSLGDATSLQGGTLLMTPLSGMAGKVYGFGQGSISVSGYDFRTRSGNRVAKNHTLAGRIPLGGILQIPMQVNKFSNTEVSVFLREPDITTSNNIANAINAKLGSDIAIPNDAAEVKVKIPSDKKNNLISFLAELENIEVQKDNIAKVVLDERSGTIVAGNNVKILPSSITYGSLNITIRSYPIISQPNAFSNGKTTVFNNLVPYVTQNSNNTIVIKGASNVQQVAAALNSLKVSPRDIIAIFQALKKAGALIGELEII